jgi:hypothetical protein
MNAFTKTEESYIEHEVQIRVHDEKFQIIERDFDDVKTSMRHLDSKFDTQFKWIVGMFVSSVILPVVFHFIKVV